MSIKGNYLLYYIFQIILGITFFVLLNTKGWYESTLIIGILCFIPMFFNKKNPDEREKSLLLKTESVTLVCITMVMFITNFLLKEYSWFNIFFSSTFFFRGLAGTFIFLKY